MDKICKICGSEFSEPSHFWKSHKVKERDYYLNFCQRVSMLTGAPIQFKSREQYMDADFNSKLELKQWIKENPDKALAYCLSIVKARHSNGKAKYALSHVETRTLCLPSTIWFRDNCNYNVECELIGLKSRFKYDMPLPVSKPVARNITVDTREQKPLAFKRFVSTVDTLKYGDYHCPDKNSSIFIERKSLSDFIGTLSSGYERFTREVERAASNNSYLIVAVEDTLSNAMSFQFLPHISKKIRASADFIFHRVREMMQNHPNMQFVFLDGRVQMANFIEYVYNFNGAPDMVDWQHAIESKAITFK